MRYSCSLVTEVMSMVLCKIQSSCQMTLRPTMHRVVMFWVMSRV